MQSFCFFVLHPILPKYKFLCFDFQFSCVKRRFLFPFIVFPGLKRREILNIFVNIDTFAKRTLGCNIPDNDDPIGLRGGYYVSLCKTSYGYWLLYLCTIWIFTDYPKQGKGEGWNCTPPWAWTGILCKRSLCSATLSPPSPLCLQTYNFLCNPGRCI